MTSHQLSTRVERFAALQAEFAAQLKEEAELNAAILANLKKVEIPSNG